MAQLLPSLKRLKVLKLKRNKINDAGAEAIFDALAKNKSVKTLHLSDNHITDKIFDKI